eukprot:m.35119 g.35119  ORF g.35119 m.35119 type:complete len:80 (+) comp10893_c0_seq2:261-500(+)
MPRKDRKAPTLLRLPTPTISKAKPRKAGDNKTKERSWMAITAVECSLNGKASPLGKSRNKGRAKGNVACVLCESVCESE